ncbi:MAG: tetratricopeptide repeat protein [Myxococcales bacterium]|nr:tetratricopeptide repeat protein [Myxococcales bacterium]
MKPALAALVLGAALVVPTPALADLWVGAKDAAAGKLHKGPLPADVVHRRAIEALSSDSVDAYLRLRAATALVRVHGGSTSVDPRLRYDLGFLLVALHDYEDAIPALHHALAYAPKHAQAGRAWFSLGISHAHRGEAEDEETAWQMALALADDPSERHVVLANLAETEMRLGRLDDALTAIEQAIDLVPQHAVTHWTRALLLDRLDDRPRALAAASVALSLDPDGKSLEGDSVFYVPPYDVYWYQALVALAQADATPEIAGLERIKALSHYTKWLDSAAPDDPFRGIAGARIAQTKALLKLK